MDQVSRDSGKACSGGPMWAACQLAAVAAGDDGAGGGGGNVILANIWRIQLYYRHPTEHFTPILKW